MEQDINDILHKRAVTLAQPIEKEEQERFGLLVFSLAQEWYGLKLNCVKEVLVVGRITTLPGAPPSIKGLVNLRGTIISATEPKELLGLVQTNASEPDTAIVITSEGAETALLVDEIFGVVEVPVTNVEPPLLTLERTGGERLLGEVECEGKLVGILDPQAILSKPASATEASNHVDL